MSFHENISLKISIADNPVDDNKKCPGKGGRNKSKKSKKEEEPSSSGSSSMVESQNTCEKSKANSKIETWVLYYFINIIKYNAPRNFKCL